MHVKSKSKFRRVVAASIQVRTPVAIDSLRQAVFIRVGLWIARINSLTYEMMLSLAAPRASIVRRGAWRITVPSGVRSIIHFFTAPVGLKSAGALFLDGDFSAFFEA